MTGAISGVHHSAEAVPALSSISIVCIGRAPFSAAGHSLPRALVVSTAPAWKYSGVFLVLRTLPWEGIRIDNRALWERHKKGPTCRFTDLASEVSKLCGFIVMKQV